jgi:hypothetical protein
MGKPQHKPNPRLNQIFSDLEAYLEFCRDYGYKFNEADLYNMRIYSFQQYNKMINGKNFKDQWADDERRMMR